MSPTPKRKESKEAKACEERIAELEASLSEERKRQETYLTQLKYARADLENLQKQTQKRIEEGVNRGLERLVIQLFPVAEELDISLDVARRESNSNLTQGIEMVRKKFWKVLEGEGLTQIEAVGKPFDPNLHEAVLELETCDYPGGTVVEELRKGYMFKGRVLRASMVKVSRNPSSEFKEENSDE